MWKFPLKATSLKFIMCTSIYTFSSSSSFSCPYITRHSNVDLPLFNGFLPGSPVAWSPFPICSFTWSFPFRAFFVYQLYLQHSNQMHIHNWIQIRVGADKSLDRPISRCRRAESIVSLDRGVYSCVELQVCSCYRVWKEACQVTRAVSTTSRRELSSSFFPAKQGAEGNSHHSDRNIRRTCTIVYHRQKLGGPV